MSPNDCTGPLTCIDDPRFPGGYCSSLCPDGDCPEGSTCVVDLGVELCLSDCGSDADCRGEYQCWRGTCRPPCSGDNDCGGGDARCTSGRCTGTECESSGDCPGERQCIEGSCVTRDASVPDASPPRDCGEGCSAGEVCLPDALGGGCAALCAERSDCADSARACSPVELDTDEDGTADDVVGACVPINPDGRFLAAQCTERAQCESNACVRRACAEMCNDDSDCIPGMICRNISYPGIDGAMFDTCWFPGRTGGSHSIEDIDLGEFTVGSGRSSNRIVFAAASDAISATLVLEQTSPGPWSSLAFDDVYSPRERALFDLDEISELRDPTIRWIPGRSDGVATMLISNTSPDRYRFEFGRHAMRGVAFREDGGATTFRARVRVNRSSGRVIRDGAINLNIFLVGVGFNASQAPSQTRLQAALRELSAIYAPRGISFATPRYLDVSADAASRLAIIDSTEGPDSELSQLFQLSDGRTEDAANIFLIRRISGADASDAHALGIAGGIPGPPGVHGTPHSGVAVSYDTAAVGRDPDTVAQIIAHELGHYLGLFHVAERARPCEPGERPSETVRCAPFGGEDVISDTSRSDGDNLMWPTVGGADGRTYNVNLTAGQGDVLRVNPLVQ